VRALALSSFALALLWSQLCLATEPPAGDEQLIRDEAHRARVWRYSWTGINGAITVGSFVAVPLVNAEERPDWVVSGAGQALSTLATWFWPLRVESAEAELDAMPAGERPKHARRLLLESSEDEHDRVTWPWHVVNFGMAAVGGGIIAFGYGHYESGLVTTLVGTALGEAQLLTQPTSLPRARPAARLYLSPRFTLLRAPNWEPIGGTVSLWGAF
jgi:hypothetical protein